MMVGACVRGTFVPSSESDAIAERYGIEGSEVPPVVELKPERVTSWRGFAATTPGPRAARHPPGAEGGFAQTPPPRLRSSKKSSGGWGGGPAAAVTREP